MNEVKTIDELYSDLQQRQKNKSSQTPDLGQMSAMRRNEGTVDLSSFSPYSSNDIYKTLNDGSRVAMYKDTMPGTDNNERLAQNQSGWEQTINGLSKAGINTGSVVLGNTAGFVYGLADWASTGNFNAVYDNSFYRGLDDINTKLGFQLPNYYGKDQKDMNFFQKATTANFWANDVMNGLSFTLGTIVSEAIWAAATGGASLAVRAGRIGAKLGQGARALTGAARVGEDVAMAARVGEEVVSAGRFGKAVLGTEKVAEGLANYKGMAYKFLDNAVSTGKMSTKTANAFAKTGEILNTTRFIATSSGNEAGIEAFHYKKEATENFYRNFEELNGRPPTAEESSEMLNKIEGSANWVMASNMAILGVSNLAMLGNLFKIKSPLGTLQKEVNNKLFGVGVKQVANETGELVYKGIQRKAWQKGAGYLYKGASPVVREGMFEEGLQGVTTKTANNWIERQYDPKYLNKIASLSDDAWKAMGEQYGTKEGWNEIGIGGIVGLIGGIRVAGKSITHEISDFSRLAEEQEKVVAKSLNAANVTMKTFVSDINAGRMMTMAKVMEAEDRAEQAMTKRDVVSAKLAHNDSMIALAEMYNNPLYGTGGLEQMERHGNNMIDTTEVSEQEKQELKAGFKSFIGEYKSANNFANSIVGSQGRIYGTDFQASDVQKALTYTILQGQSSKKMMDESLAEIGGFMGKDKQDAINRNEDLQSLDKDTRTKFNQLAKEHQALETRSEALQKKIQLAEISVKEGQESRLPALQREILEVEKRKLEINGELEVIAGKIATNKKLASSFGKELKDIPMTDEFISVKDLLGVEKNLTELEEAYKTLEAINPVSAQAVKASMANYQRAQKALLDHNSAIKLIASGKFKPQLADTNPFSGIYKKFAKGEEKADEHTSQFLTRLNEIRNSYKNSVMEESQEKSIEDYQKAIDEIKAKETLTEEDTAKIAELEGKIEALKPTEKPVEVVKDDTPTRKEAPQKELSPVEALKARIEDILKLFKTSFVGTYDVDEAVKNRPDQKDIEKYRELSAKGEETEELQELKAKLSQWRVYDSLAEDEQSVADLLDLVAQLETEIEEENTVSEPNIEDTFEELKKTATVDILELSVNTNYPITVKRELSGSYSITHMNPSSLLQRMGATNVKIGKKEVSFQEVDNHKKQGMKVTFVSGGVQMSFEIKDRGRIEISQKDFQAIPNVKTIESLSSWTYPTLYEQAFEGNWKPISSDFSDPNITGDSNNLKDEDALELFVDVNNEYNQKLLKDKVKGEDLENQVVIYIRKGGENYGTIKGLTQANRDEMLGSEASIFTLRKLAAEALKEGKSGVVATTQVKYVQLGNPILNIDGSGRISQIAISDLGLKNIVATGFVQDGEITLNKEVKDVRKSFIKKVSGKNKGKKVPIVVIKRGAQMIAFPVQMVKTNDSKKESLYLILDNQELTDAQKVTAVNNLLIENGIAPREFELTTFDEQKIAVIEERLDANQSYKTAEQLADKSYKKENLVNDATIALDLENLSVSLPSQKFNIDLENLDYEDLPEPKIEKQEQIEKKAEKTDNTPKTASAKRQVNNKKTPVKKHTVEFTIEDFQIKALPKPLADKVKKQTSKNKVIDYTQEDLIALKKAGVVTVERGVAKKSRESKVADAEEIAKEIVEKFTPIEIDKETVEDIIAEEMKTSEDNLDKIALKIFKSRLSPAEYLLQIDNEEEAQAILADVGYIEKRIKELTPKVEIKPSTRPSEKISVPQNGIINRASMISFEGIDFAGKPFTYYKKGNVWGYITEDRYGNEWFESFMSRAQSDIESKYQNQKELTQTEKEENCK